MASRLSSHLRLRFVLLALAGCAEPTLDMGAGHPANADASVRPVASPPVALSSGYDPAVHLPPPPRGGHDHHQHHGHGDHTPPQGGAGSGEHHP